MFVPGYFLLAVAKVIDYALVFFMWIVVARAILSWVNPDPRNSIVRLINKITEPVLYQIRARMPFGVSGIDLSPIVVFLIILFLRTFLVNSLIRFANTLL
jgi:YggT family protein